MNCQVCGRKRLWSSFSFRPCVCYLQVTTNFNKDIQSGGRDLKSGPFANEKRIVSHLLEKCDVSQNFFFFFLFCVFSTQQIPRSKILQIQRFHKLTYPNVVFRIIFKVFLFPVFFFSSCKLLQFCLSSLFFAKARCHERDRLVQKWYMCSPSCNIRSLNQPGSVMVFFLNLMLWIQRRISHTGGAGCYEWSYPEINVVRPDIAPPF